MRIPWLLIQVLFWAGLSLAALDALPWWAAASAVLIGLALATFSIRTDLRAARVPGPDPGEWEPRPRKRDPVSPD